MPSTPSIRPVPLRGERVDVDRRARVEVLAGELDRVARTQPEALDGGEVARLRRDDQEPGHRRNS